jgi:hypothetical protein
LHIQGLLRHHMINQPFWSKSTKSYSMAEGYPFITVYILKIFIFKAF